jgi:molybdopterin converting factor small subunit
MIHLKLFASLRELTGTGEEVLALPDHVETLAQLRE